MTIYFAAIGSGLGDIIISLPILQYLIETGEPTYLVARSPRQENLAELMPGLAGVVQEPEFIRMSIPTTDKCYNFRSHPIQRDYIWGSAEFERAFPGIHINEMLEIICKDYGLNVSFSKLTPFPYSTIAKASGKIILIPGTVIDQKVWPLQRWLKLIGYLKARNLQTLMIGEPALNPIVQELLDAGVSWLETPRVIDALQTISSSAAVISVDTGLMHLAVHQGKPTIALFNNDAMYLRPYSNCYPLIASTCHIDCLKAFQNPVSTKDVYETWAWYDGRYKVCRVGEEERCLSSITPESVIDQLDNFRFSSATKQ